MLRIHDEKPFIIKQITHAAACAEVAAADLERLAQFAGRAVAVVGEDRAEDGDAAGAVTFVDDVFVVVGSEFAGPFFDRAFDVVLGATHGAGLVDRVAEPQIRVGIAAAVLGRDLNGAAKLAEQLAARGVNGSFAMSDVGGMGVACHDDFQLLRGWALMRETRDQSDSRRRTRPHDREKQRATHPAAWALRSTRGSTRRGARLKGVAPEDSLGSVSSVLSAELLANLGEAFIGRDRFRGGLLGGSPRGFRLRGLAQLEVNVAEMLEDRGVGRGFLAAGLGGLFQRLHGLFRLPALEQNPAETVEIGVVVGVFLQRLADHRLGLFQMFPLIGVQIAEVVVHARVVGVLFEEGFQFGLAFGVITHVDVNDRQV